MTPLRTRIALGLAVGAAVIAVPLTASAAFAATPPPGKGWHQVGEERWTSWRACHHQMQQDLKLSPKYHQATCVKEHGRFYSEWMR